MVGDHGHGLVDPDHLAHAFDRARGRLVQRFRLAAEHGMAIAATFIPGCFVSIPNFAWPLTLSGVSSRLAGVPIRVKSFGSFSAKLSGVGTGRAAAASTNCP